ncbi:MAG: hypothetical protein EPO68_12035, partial [Planctomycetota bacterium]
MLSAFRSILFSCVLLPGACAVAQQDLAAPPAQDPAARSAPGAAQAAPASQVSLAQPVVVGASISDGFGLRRETQARTGFGDYLNAAISAPHGEIRSFASAFLFQDPLARGEQQIQSALGAAPTLLVALDFPFWFAYGNLPSEEERPRLLELGLALLARYDGPTLICDLPDMSPALQGEKVMGMRMIVESQVPAPATLKLLNEKLAAWAAARPNVTLVPMGQLLDDLRADRPVVVRGVTYRKADLPKLLQPDLLHATSEG